MSAARRTKGQPDGGPRQRGAVQHTFLVAVDFIRAVILAVVEVVAAKDGADAAAVGAEELVLLAHGLGRWHCSRKIMKRVCYHYLQVPILIGSQLCNILLDITFNHNYLTIIRLYSIVMMKTSFNSTMNLFAIFVSLIVYPILCGSLNDPK